MSMRTPTIILVPLIVGLVAAKATAPQIVDPRDDLPEVNPNLVAAPPAASRPMANPDASHPQAGERDGIGKPHSSAGSSAATKGELPANPLWTIPLSLLTETRARPPFSPNRRAPQPAPLAKAVAPPPLKPAEPVKPQISLVGTVVGGGRRVGVFVNLADKSTFHLKAGEKHDGWVLRAVDAHQVELANGLDSAVLKLPAIDMKSVAAAPVPQSPIGAASQGMPIPSSPLNAAKPATDGPHMGINVPSLASQSLIKPKP